MRNSATTVANSIDGKCENIPNHFAGIYKNLYNSANDDNDLLDVQHALNKNIHSINVEDALKITPTVIADAVMHLKEEESDPIFEFSSDCVKNAPLIFYKHLATFLKTSNTWLYQLCVIVSYFGSTFEGQIRRYM